MHHITHVNPTQKRVTSSIILFTDTLDNALNAKPAPSENRNTFRRPHVSAMKPQKCDVNTTPKKAIALIMPCSLVEMLSSHLAAGSTNAILRPSMIMPSSAKPVVSSRAR